MLRLDTWTPETRNDSLPASCSRRWSGFGFRPVPPDRLDRTKGIDDEGMRDVLRGWGRRPVGVARAAVPGSGQVLLGVEATGVGPWDRLLNDVGWDVGLRPAALGVEGAGRVLAVGADVGKFAVGDRVLAHEAPLPGGSGFGAERVLITSAQAAACPHGVDPVLAGALPVNGLTGKALSSAQNSLLVVTRSRSQGHAQKAQSRAGSAGLRGLLELT